MRTRMQSGRTVGCRRRSADRAEPRSAAGVVPDEARRVVTMPSGPGAAAEAFAWLNRQLSWQSTLAGLEAEAGFAASETRPHTDGEAVRQSSLR